MAGKATRSESLARSDLCLHIGEPSLLVHEEAAQVVLIAPDSLHLTIKHHVQVYFVPFKSLAHFILGE